MYYFEISKDDWFIQLLGVFLSSLFAFLIALFIFHRENKKKEDDERKRLFELKEYLFQSMKYLYWGIFSQTNSLTEILIKCKNEVIIEKEVVIPVILEMEVGISPDNIERVSFNDMFKLFVLTNNQKDKITLIENYQRFLGNLKILKIDEQNLLENYKRENDEYEYNAKLLLEVIENVRNIFRKEIPLNEEEILEKLKSDKLFYTMDQCLKNLPQGDITLESYMNGLILPLLNICILNHDLPIARSIAELCSSAKQIYIRIIQSKKLSIEIYEIVIKRFNFILSNISKLVEIVYANRIDDFKLKPKGIRYNLNFFLFK